MRIATDAAVQSELTAIAFEIMANKRRLSVTSDEGEEEEEEEDGIEVQDEAPVRRF